jgi:hypothetical protein
LKQRLSLGNSDDRFFHHAQQFLDLAQHQASAAQAAVAEAIESTRTMMDFFGVEMKPKVCLAHGSHNFIAFV